jgi:hypothetical protein
MVFSPSGFVLHRPPMPSPSLPTLAAGDSRPAKTVSIIQSNYIPWKGYFDIVGLSDEFIVLDTVQFTKNDWRNRNRIKTAAGPAWLTIPVRTGGRFGQTIAETEIADPAWAERHWARLQASYGGQPGFALHGGRVAAAYAAAAKEDRLSEVNRRFIELACELLGIGARITSAADYPDDGEKTARVVGLCVAAGATRYLSGPAARAYLDEARFAAAGVEVRFMDYEGYPEYPQLHPPFEHKVSALDLLFNTGPDARSFMLAGR